jgi:lipoprotein-anchoring transpeptidase ErfK/SrfK
VRLRRARARAFAVAVAASAVVVLGSACGGSRPTLTQSASSATTETLATSTTTTAAVRIDASYVGAATGPQVAVYGTADTAAPPAQTIANPTENGAPLVFLLTAPDNGVSDPVPVYLPVRPNGSTGFVRRVDLRITTHQYRIKVEVGAHRITVTKAGEIILQEPAGIGTSQTPTPGGVFYVKELLQPPNPNGAYGPYAYGLSGYSNVLTSFAGGDGVIGIHGTNDPSSLGKDASHGCIRMSNEGITRLAQILPLGTPVEILP